MNLTLEHFSHPEHSLILKEDVVIGEDAKCHVCNKPVIGSPTYTCSTVIVCQSFYLHKTCAELPTKINHHEHNQHPLTLLPRPLYYVCDFCGDDVKFAYACDDCKFDVCVVCAFVSSLRHFGHPEHPLILKEDVVIGVDAICYVCQKSVVGSPTYTCAELIDIDIDCQNFYLHKTCAELPIKINHPKHNQHPLNLLPAPFSDWLCDICYRVLRLGYICDDCEFDVCVFCAFEQRELHHPGHMEHTLLLIQRESLFTCDACYKEAKDSSYVCATCQFWIHKECALSPFTIPDPTYHHHPLNLIYSIPDIHRYFRRYCAICKKKVHTGCWMYYCHKCTYFVHMKCATSTVSIANEIEADDGVDNDPDLLQFPLPTEESIFQLIITQCGNLQLGFQGEPESAHSISTIPHNPHIIEEHWSHKTHPLELLLFTNISENDNGNDDDDTSVLICDGCIQPITVSHPSYYACIQCGFILHSFCATKLPLELPKGASTFHPEHSLLLRKSDRFYSFVECGACRYSTNGFYYQCSTCDFKIDMRCAFLPARIKHKSHKHHSLVQRPFSNSRCSVSGFVIEGGVEYACETNNCNFQIDILCVFYPSRVKHRYDDHSLTLRLPPFFYEGVFYCEICEEQVDNQEWLYHCEGCDHSFHYDCVRWYESVKLGGTIQLNFGDEQSHTFALVLKRSIRKNSPPYFCSNCGDDFSCSYFFECEGCGFLDCCDCAKLEY